MSISAIDLGFMYTKSIVDGRRHIMKSVVGQGRKLRFRDLDMGGDKGKDDIIFEDSVGTSFVSDLAIDQSEVVFHSLRDKRFDTATTDVLVKTALGMGLTTGHHTTNIVSGLPVSHYDIFKDDITNLFLGETGQGKCHGYAVQSRGESYIGTVDIEQGRFLPQPFGALLDYLLDDNGKFVDEDIVGDTIAVIDPGFGTTDIYVVDGLTPVERLTFSTKVAMNYAYGLIGNKVEQELGKTVPLYEIEGIVLTGELRKGGKRYNMRPVIDFAFQVTAEKLINEVLNKWKDGINDIEHIVVSGGGGFNLFPYLEKEFPSIEMIEDPQWAVVNGYYKWGVRSFA
jgi:plasmid segregation protein ParM